MRTTSELIDALSTDAAPSGRLAPPAMRAAGWLLLAAAVLALLAVSHGLRPDLLRRTGEASFLLGIAGSALTAVLAALAACLVSLPDRSPRWALLPVPGVLLWFVNVGAGCFGTWVGMAPEALASLEPLRCLATLVLTSLPLGLALLIMLRHAAPIRPGAAAATGSLAVAAVTSTALALFHPLDATVMILMWNLGTAVLIAGLGRAFGARLLGWIGGAAAGRPASGAG